MGRNVSAVVLLGSLLSSGCAGRAAAGSGDPPPVELSTQAGDTRVELAMNQEVDLTLGTIGPGQYGEPTISSPAVQFEGMTFPPMQSPGGPQQLFKFRAVGAGSAVVTIPHDVKPAFTLTLSCCAQ